MKFSDKDILPILRSSMPRRFSDMPADDFEEFVARLFSDDGYSVVATPKSGDFGVDILAKRKGATVGIQVKRYSKNNRVGVNDVNQLIGGKGYHECDQIICITTSSFTRNAQQLAHKANVELWGWSELQQAISRIYLSGKNYQDYFKSPKATSQGEDVAITAALASTRRAQMKGNFNGLIVYLWITNNTDRNIDLEIGNANYVTVDNRQYEARGNYAGYFTEGVLYAGASTEVANVFDMAQLRRISKGDAIYIQVAGDGRVDTLTVSIEASSTSDCMVATACFKDESAPEVRLLRAWRDTRLQWGRVGKIVIVAYYRIGPTIADWLDEYETGRTVVRAMLKLFVRCMFGRQDRAGGNGVGGVQNGVAREVSCVYEKSGPDQDMRGQSEQS